MMKKKPRRIKRIISAYLLRIGIILMLLLMLILMVCGCLYIFELFKNDKAIPTKSEGIQNNSTVSETSRSENQELTDFCVVLDPGHGGSDGGTVKGNVVEKDINLSVALKVKEILEGSNIGVVLTRNKDECMELSQRVTIANNSEADVFVSLHCNFYEDDEAIAGMECYYSGSDAIESKEFAESIIHSAALVDDIITREAKPEGYYILRQTTMPAVLVEMGFLSNPSECQKLINKNYQKKLAEQLSAGIVQQLENGG